LGDVRTTLARKLRSNMTDAEHRLWQALRDRLVEGHRFRRQVPLGPYIVDFCCVQLGLVIEADGSQHSESKSDQLRDAWLAEQGYRVLRFWNVAIQKDFEGAMESILRAVADREAELAAFGRRTKTPASLAVASLRHPHPRYARPPPSRGR
jgi:very-short-patch-repair endonuclease